MPLAVFTEVPDFNYVWEDVPPPAEVFDRDPTVARVRVDLAPARVALRRYVWNMERDDTEVPAIDAFFLARRWTLEAFLLLDPKIPTRTDVALPNATTGQTVFSLPVPILLNGENSRDYPKDDVPNTVLKLNGTPQTIASVDQDARTITITGGAAGGETVLASYIPYRLVELVQRFTWTPAGVNYQAAAPELMEVRG
jgi:hypothetical protein